MRNILISLLLAYSLFLPSSTYAQGAATSPESSPISSPQGENRGEPGVGGGPGTQDDRSNLWWLLPLLAIPLLYYLWRRGGQETRNERR